MLSEQEVKVLEDKKPEYVRVLARQGNQAVEDAYNDGFEVGLIYKTKVVELEEAIRNYFKAELGEGLSKAMIALNKVVKTELTK